jgi:DNA-binding response OmpR family regulator
MMPTALIVEDEPAANQLLSMLVQMKGYATDSAFTGHEAIRKADLGRPDLIFLDLMLPDLNGYEVCKRLRGSRATHDIPIVMVTARLAEENRLQGIAAGALEYVPKPYTPDQIFGAMTRADSWQHRIDELAESGEVPIDASDELANLEYVSDLHRLVLSHTDLAEGDASRLVSILLEVFDRAFVWGRSHACRRVASLGFEFHPDQIRLTLRDDSAWLADEGQDRTVRVLMADAGFSCGEPPGDGELQFRRRLPAP